VNGCQRSASLILNALKSKLVNLFDKANQHGCTVYFFLSQTSRLIALVRTFWITNVFFSRLARRVVKTPVEINFISTGACLDRTWRRDWYCIRRIGCLGPALVLRLESNFMPAK
jgi:hypothetical protein